MYFPRDVLLSMLLLISVWGCRSISPNNPTNSAVKLDEPKEAVAVASTNKAPSEVPAKSPDLMMWQRLDVDSAGNQKRLGVVRCRKEQGISSCFVQNSTGKETLMDNTTSQIIRAKLEEVRKDIEVELRVIADIVCDVSSESTPPYSSKDAHCHYERVRAFNENLVDGDLAFELVSLLRGDAILGDGSTTVSGVVSCRVSQRKINASCSVRRILRGGISNDAAALGKSESVMLSELMIVSLNEVRLSQSQGALTDLPKELAGSVQCVVNSKEMDSAGLRESKCFIRM